MSKVKMVQISKAQLIKILDAKGLSQRKLCEMINDADQYSGLTPEYLSKCLKEEKISASLMGAISRELDVIPEYLSGETDAPLPERWSKTEKSWSQELEIISAMMGLSLHHRLELSDLEPGDQESLSIMLQYVCYYFTANKGYLDSFKDCKGERITDGQLLDYIREIMEHGASKRDPEPLAKLKKDPRAKEKSQDPKKDAKKTAAKKTK